MGGDNTAVPTSPIAGYILITLPSHLSCDDRLLNPLMLYFPPFAVPAVSSSSPPLAYCFINCRFDVIIGMTSELVARCESQILMISRRRQGQQIAATGQSVLVQTD